METRYRKVKCSERLPEKRKNNSVISETFTAAWETFSEGIVKIDSYYNHSLKGWCTPFINLEDIKYEPSYWLEPIPPEAEEQQSQVGEEGRKALESLLLQKGIAATKEEFESLLKCYHPTPKKVPTVDALEKILKPKYANDVYTWFQIKQAIHSLLPDQNREEKACEHGHVMYISPIKKWLCYECERLFNRIPNVIKSEPTK